LAGWVLSRVGWDPSIFAGFGEEARPTREYAEARIGEVFLRSGQGHDGKFFFVQSNDPWVLDPAENAMVLDRPLYRSQRMLYPVLASAGGLFSAEIVVWSLIVVNALAMGAGTWATAVIATQMGMSVWWGLAFTLNIGFISELNIDGAGIVAAALAFGAVALITRRRVPSGIVLLALAALSREAMLIAAAGTAWWLWRFRGRRREAAFALTIPLIAVVLWALYLRMRIGFESGASEVEELGLPFVGFAQALAGWSTPLDIVLGLAILLLFVLYTRRVLISSHLVGWAFLGFVGLGVMFTEQVWQNYFDITRAIAPIITSFVLLMFAPVAEPQRTGVRL
jgi:hypothetical protein